MDKEKTLELFSSIAPKYDLLNHLLSLNIDRIWRKMLTDCARMQPDDRILDVCTGTGDIAIEFARRGCSGKIIGIDISDRMLRIAQQKIEKLKLQRKITLQKGDGLKLPFENETFDIVTIGFGLRNLIDYKSGISEMARVLKSGGRLLILEFSLPQNPGLSGIYCFYLKMFVPLIGGIISGSKSAYGYLSSSIQNFLRYEEVLKLMKANKLKNLCFKELTGGIASMYWGEK